jgi:AcrR family transcriptional regulator
MSSKEHIIKVAFRLFQQHSYKEVTMKDIVESTGLSKGAVYHHFESKEQLFREILEYFFADLLDIDYSQFTRDSLHRFYIEMIEFAMSKTRGMMKKGDGFNINTYSLIFDALKVLPDFRVKFMELHEKELNAWKSVIRTARKKGEIKTTMTDEQIAKYFVYTGDGVGIRMIVTGDMVNMHKEVIALWNAFYKQLKK